MRRRLSLALSLGGDLLLEGDRLFVCATPGGIHAHESLGIAIRGELDPMPGHNKTHRAARHFQETKLTRDEAFTLLQSLPKLPAADEKTEKGFARIQDSADYFIQHPDRACLPRWPNYLRCETAEEFGLLVSASDMLSPGTSSRPRSLSRGSPLGEPTAAPGSPSRTDSVLTPRCPLPHAPAPSAAAP